MEGTYRIMLLLPAMCLLMLSVSGCDNRFAWAGEWHGERQLPHSVESDTYMLNTARSIRLEIASEMTARVQDAGITMDGYVRGGSESAEFYVQNLLGRPVETVPTFNRQPIRLEVVSEDEITYFNPNGFDQGPIVLRRQSKP
jgi:hypothetical protein